MSALTKIEFERDTHCVEISLFAQCRALVDEGMATEIDGLIARTRVAKSQAELDKIQLIKELALGSRALIN
jgi:outer membrane protein TolC